MVSILDHLPSHQLHAGSCIKFENFKYFAINHYKISHTALITFNISVSVINKEFEILNLVPELNR